MKNGILVAMSAILLYGCATSGGFNIGAGRTPIVDYQASPAAQQGRNFDNDLNYCRNMAAQSSPVEQGVIQGLGGAALGAAAGAAVGAITGQPGRGAAIGAAGGGILGVGRGVGSGVEEQEIIVNNCLRGRGWNVLN